MQFSQSIIANYLRSTKQTEVLVQCIAEVTMRVRSITDNQIVGLLAASFELGHSSWQASMSALRLLEEERYKVIMEQFQIYLDSHYNKGIAEWCCEFQKCISEQEFSLISALQKKTSGHDYTLLLLSLCVVIDNEQEFITYNTLFARNGAGAIDLLVDAIANHPN